MLEIIRFLQKNTILVEISYESGFTDLLSTNTRIIDIFFDMDEYLKFIFVKHEIHT